VKWEDITVGQFQQLYDIITGQNFDHELERQAHLLACMEGKPIEHYESMPIHKLKEEAQKTAFLSVADIPNVPAPREVTIAGHKFRVLYDFRDLCAGQFIDVMSIAKTPEEHIMNLNRMLAAFCLPLEGKKVLPYGKVPFDDVADLMLQLPIVQAQSIALFFYRAWERFLKAIPGCLEKKLKKGKELTETEALIHQIALESGGAG
jgi:hypothetical protein